MDRVQGALTPAELSHGYSVGETSVYDLDDGASDHHYHDSYAGAAGNWHDWQSWGHDYTTGNPNITGWYANLVTCGVYTEYVVKQNRHRVEGGSLEDYFDRVVASCDDERGLCVRFNI